MFSSLLFCIRGNCMSHWPARTCLVHESGRQCTHHHMEQCCSVKSKRCAQFVFYLLNNLSSTYITYSISQRKYASKTERFLETSLKGQLPQVLLWCHSVCMVCLQVSSLPWFGFVCSLVSPEFGLVLYWFCMLTSVPLILKIAAHSCRLLAGPAALLCCV